MTDAVGYLGPAGTYSEAAALRLKIPAEALVPFPTIARILDAVAEGALNLGVVPVENSLEGGVSMTLDTLWQLDGLQVQMALILPIRHMLLSYAASPAQLRAVYSHPQALGQCQQWLRHHAPQAELIPANSTTQEIDRIRADPSVAMISAEQAARRYDLPILAGAINDQPHNATRFWTVGRRPSPGGSVTSLAFSLPNPEEPGALLKPLQLFAQRRLNMTRIESRPTKRSAGTYVFFIDLEHPGADRLDPEVALQLTQLAETLKIFGSYPVRSDL